MKGNSGSRKLPVLMVLLGIIGFVLRKSLYSVAVDAKGLLLRNSPLGLALTVLTAVALLLAVWAARTRKDACSGEKAALPGAFGNVAAGAGVLATVLTAAPMTGGYLESVWRILGLAAPVCFALAGIAVLFGKKPFFLLHVVPCLFFLVHIVTRYQLWSGNPQLQDYVFALLGAAALMLFCFYTAAREADCGSRPMILGMGLAAIYLCLVELARSSCPALYLGGVLWVLTDLAGARERCAGKEK